jgi:hypothetical protein
VPAENPSEALVFEIGGQSRFDEILSAVAESRGSPTDRPELGECRSVIARAGMQLAQLSDRKEVKMKLDIKAFSLTCGVIWGLGLPLLTWWIMAFDGGSTDPTWIGHIYRGYNMTFAGSLIGGVWAFFDGLVGGAIFAWLYDFIGERAMNVHRMAA